MREIMIRSLIGVLLLFGIMSAGTAAVAAEKSSGPVAVVEEPEYDFGSVYGGKAVYHSFEIKNTGDAPLVIEDVKTG